MPNLVTLTKESDGPINVIQFTEKGRNEYDWIQGKSWGLRGWNPGENNQGSIFILKLVQKSAIPSVAVGPNKRLRGNSLSNKLAWLRQ